MKMPPGLGWLGWQMLVEIVKNCALFAEFATMQPFPQNGHFSLKKWPFEIDFSFSLLQLI